MADDGPGSRKTLFDGWARDYDRSVSDIADAELFPFAGYDGVLGAICAALDVAPRMTVLDLGTGTGNLARRLLGLGCTVTGTDLSPEMLAAAREKVPEAQLVEADLQRPWPAAIDGPFDRIASAYVLHELDLAAKVTALDQARRRLAPNGKIVIGDIGFPTVAAREAAHDRWHDRWDHDEHYWAADEAIAEAERVGLRGRWTAISICAGILVFEPAETISSPAPPAPPA